MAKGEALKQFKDEQKAVTAEKIKQANIYAICKSLIDDFEKVDLAKESNNEKVILDKSIMEENKLLKKQVRDLQDDRKQLMDKIVAMKITSA